jgi:predicted PurR-regulated permease PerM
LSRKFLRRYSTASRGRQEVWVGKHGEQLTALGKFALSAAAGAGVTLLQFMVYIIIVGVLLVYARNGADAVDRLTTRLVGRLIWSLLVNLSDNVLKPQLIGRGLDIPMPVILLGAIGGMIMSGFNGLFVVAMVLSVGYTRYSTCLNEGLNLVAEPGSGDATGN